MENCVPTKLALHAPPKSQPKGSRLAQALARGPRPLSPGFFQRVAAPELGVKDVVLQFQQVRGDDVVAGFGLFDLSCKQDGVLHKAKGGP